MKNSGHLTEGIVQIRYLTALLFVTYLIQFHNIFVNLTISELKN